MSGGRTIRTMPRAGELAEDRRAGAAARGRRRADHARRHARRHLRRSRPADRSLREIRRHGDRARHAWRQARQSGDPAAGAVSRVLKLEGDTGARHIVEAQAIRSSTSRSAPAPASTSTRREAMRAGRRRAAGLRVVCFPLGGRRPSGASSMRGIGGRAAGRDRSATVCDGLASDNVLPAHLIRLGAQRRAISPTGGKAGASSLLARPFSDPPLAAAARAVAAHAPALSRSRTTSSPIPPRCPPRTAATIASSTITSCATSTRATRCRSGA